MKLIGKNTVAWSALALLVLAVAGVAQGPPPPPPGGPHDVMFMGGPGPMGDEFGESKTVKGLPLSAEIVVVRDTTLADGNKIHNESTTKVYRDAEGRMRREMGIGLGLATAAPVKHNVVTITDPVAGTRYMLNPDNKTARQTALRGPRDGKGPMKDHADQMKAMGASDVTKEQLGTKTINGMQAEGVRVTRTIPAGAMGNEKAISVVTERWYSPDLQMVVMTTHTDPMMGTVTTKLVNVNQGAQDAALFQVPSDYTVKTGRAGDPMYMPAPR
jgi:hypothetical protein